MVLLPIIGMIIYFVLRPHDLETQPSAATQYQKAREDAGITESTVDQLARLGDLRDAGAISDDEFKAMKAKLLA